MVRAEKRGAIDDQAPLILARLNVEPGVWRQDRFRRLAVL
jgi:hypothetical protein